MGENFNRMDDYGMYDWIFALNRSELEKKVVELEDMAGNYETNIDSLNATIVAREDTIRDLEEQIDFLQDEIARLNDVIAYLER